MAGANSKEAKYRAQLEAQGVWCDAFQAAVHDLCILERRRSRAMAEWKATAEPGRQASMLHPLYDVILGMDQEIAKQRESLGLTAKGMRRLKPPEDNIDKTVEIRVVFGGAEKWAL